MSELKPPTGAQKEFEPHPAGSYMAVCADVYTVEQPNKFYGTVKDNGKVDTKEKVVKAVLVFLTDEMVDVGGKLQPAYASSWNTFSWGTEDYPSNLFKLVKSWFPTAPDERIREMDLNKLVGQGAYVTITNDTGKNGKTYANISTISSPPKGAAIPAIPADFKRHEEKAKEQPAQNPTPLKMRDDRPPVGNFPAGPKFDPNHSGVGRWPEAPPPHTIADMPPMGAVDDLPF